MPDPVQPIVVAAQVPPWLKWLVGTLVAALVAAGPGVGSLYLSAKKQAQEAEIARAETQAKAEVLRFAAFTKATDAGGLRNDLNDCRDRLDKLVDRLASLPDR